MGITRIIFLGDRENKALAALRAYAEKNVIQAVRFLRMVSGAEKPIGDDPNHAASVPGGLRVVLSLEEQPNGIFRHASFSVWPRTKQLPLPNTAVVRELLEPLGFCGSLEHCEVWVEGGFAVNVIQKDQRRRG